MPRVVVLLEGASDVAAVRAALGRSLTDPPAYAGVELVDMGGVTNVRHRLAAAVQDPEVARVLGMCDAAERAHVARALAGLGADPEDLPQLGFHVCHADLEDELVRALGAERTVAELTALGLAERFDRFRRQPAWRERPLADQVRRFAGVASGRKALFAQALASALDPATLPPPLAGLRDQVRLALTEPVRGPAVRPFPVGPG